MKLFQFLRERLRWAKDASNGVQVRKQRVVLRIDSLSRCLSSGSASGEDG